MAVHRPTICWCNSADILGAESGTTGNGWIHCHGRCTYLAGIVFGVFGPDRLIAQKSWTQNSRLLLMMLLKLIYTRAGWKPCKNAQKVGHWKIHWHVLCTSSPTNHYENSFNQINLTWLIIGGRVRCRYCLRCCFHGLSVALVGENDFVWQWAVRSTKLIHGGLRYLKQLEFGLVKEVGSERAVVHKLAPHLVIPEKGCCPFRRVNRWAIGSTSIGLKIYDWLAGVKADDRRKC